MANRTINFFQRLRAALMKASGTENTVLRVRAVQTDGKRYNPVNHGVSMKKLDESPYMVNLLKPHPTENNAFELLIDADTLIESLEDAGLYDTVAANFRVSGNDIVYDRSKPDGTIVQAGITITNMFSGESDTLFDTGEPDNGIGNDGDEYLDTSTGIIYQKESGIWTPKIDLNTLDNQIASEVPFDPTGTAYDSGSTDVDKALKEAGSRVQDLESFETSATAELGDHETRIQTEEGVSVNHEARIQSNEALAHSHSNKALLDTYMQTEADLADAVAKKHAHANSSSLDNITGSGSVEQYLSGTTEYVPIYMTLTELRAYTGNATRVQVSYNGTVGVFELDPADTTSADNTGTIVLDGKTPTAGRWKRKFEGPVYPEWFGTDGVDDTAAIQAAVNLGQDVQYRAAYVLTSTVNVLSNQKHRGGTFSDPNNLSTLFLATSKENVRFESMKFVGSENLTSWEALNSAEHQERRSFIHIIGGNDNSVHDVVGLEKRTTVHCEGALRSKISFVRSFGFMPDISQSVTEANYAPSIFIDNCTEYSVKDCYAEYVGDLLIVGSSSTKGKVLGNHVKQAHDNGIYISSGIGTIIIGNTATYIKGNGIKARGICNTVALNKIDNTNSIGISMTGLTINPDAYAATGHGILCEGNQLENTTGGISVSIADTYYARNVKVANNFIFECIANTVSASDAAILVIAVREVEVTNNTISTFGNDYGIFVAGTATTPLVMSSVIGNRIAGGLEALHFNYLTEPIVAENVLDSITNLIAVDFNVCSGVLFVNNKSVDKTKRPDFRGSTGIRCFNNEMTCGFFDAGTFEAEGNYAQSLINVVSVVPSRIGQTTVYNGQAYIAIGVASTSDWKQITN